MKKLFSISKPIFLMIICALLLFPNHILSAETTDEQKSLEVSIDDAILMALENNSSLQIERLKPEIRESRIIQEESAFDTRVSSSVSAARSETDGDSSTRSKIDLEVSKGLKSGGQISMGLSTGRSTGGLTASPYSSDLDMTLSHPLFKGAGTSVTLASLKKSELSSLSSQYELQSFAESLITQVINAYLDYSLAEQQLDIYERSLDLSQRQYDEIKTMIEVGRIAEIDLVAAEAEVSLRYEALINAKSTVEKSKFRLLRLLNPSVDNYWDYKITIKDTPYIPDFYTGNLNDHIHIALLNRPDLMQAKIQLEQNKIDLMVTKNGLLPNLSFFVSMGSSGYSDSFAHSIRSISASDNNISAGLSYSQSIGSRSDRERHKQTVISNEQSEIAFYNMTQLAIEDVGVAWLEVERAKEQITATAASKKLQEAKTQAEMAKYRVGKSTSLQVAQSQRDLTQSEINEIRAVIYYKKAIIDLYRNEGILMSMSGIEFP